eukprot:CAMPEP_0168771744 /NCGR_PEP_ID=MMETSP0725-20121227/3597_1 /TAXON_ID=265536 /ORGANISM="Amphiprora sp., Strain CCMP467" /LENGTH=246 /DNA_ID=CAMNT_0008821237 /DNA_START=41 /DNA_END=784 /DNA_ORIENTATION=+
MIRPSFSGLIVVLAVVALARVVEAYLPPLAPASSLSTRGSIVLKDSSSDNDDSSEPVPKSQQSAAAAELAQRNLLAARLKMQQLKIKGRQEQAANIKANFIAIETAKLVSQQVDREAKQSLAASLARNFQLKTDAQLQQEERHAKQLEAQTMAQNAQRSAAAAEAKAQREALQLEAATRIRFDRLQQQALAEKQAREDKQARAVSMMEKSKSSSSPEAIANKYAAIDDVGERAYEILKDLGAFASS